VSFDLTRGEIMLVAFILGLVYFSGLLPKVAKALSPKESPEPEEEAPKGSGGPMPPIKGE